MLQWMLAGAVGAAGAARAVSDKLGDTRVYAFRRAASVLPSCNLLQLPLMKVTRGTDLKIYPSAKGALTPGLGNPKDHIVQAVMRLRQLGTTQSIASSKPPCVLDSSTPYNQ